MLKKFHILFAVMLCLMLVTAACGQAADDPDLDPDPDPIDDPGEDDEPGDEGPVEGGTLTVAVANNPRNIDPRLQWDGASMVPLSNLVDRFFTIAEDGTLRPLLATEWYTNEDSTEFTFELRQDAKFHDGTDVTAESIVESILWTAAQPEYPQANFWTNLESVEAMDSHTLVVRTESPVAATEFFRNRLYSPWPISLQQQEDHGDEGVTEPISTGPFAFVSYTGDDQIVLERFDDYWGGAPYLDQLVFRVIPDTSTRRVEMEAGTVDVLMNVEPRDVEAFEDHGLNIIVGPAPINAMVSMNLASEPLQDLEVRQALAHALNREAMIDRVFYGYATMATTYLHPSNIYHNSSVSGFDYDLDLAKTLLDEAGWELGEDDYRFRDGERLELEIASHEVEPWGIMSQILQDQLRSIGIAASITTTDTTAFYNSVRGGTYDIAYWVLSGNSWDQMGHPNLRTEDWGNISHMRDSSAEIQALQQEINDIILEFDGALDEETREATTYELQQVMNENVVTIPLWFPDRIYVTQPYVRGLEAPTVVGMIRFEKAWLDK